MRFPVFALLTPVLCCAPTVAADPPRPAGVDIVPSGSFAFLTVRVSDLNTVEALKPVKEVVARLEKIEGPAEKLAGIPIADMDRVTFFWPAMLSDDPPGPPVAVLTTVKPFNEAKVLKALKATPALDGAKRGHRSVYGARQMKPTAPGAVAPPGPPPGPFAPGPGGAPPGVFPPPPPKVPGPPAGPPKFDARIGDEPPKDPPAPPAGGDQPVPDKDAVASPDLYFLDDHAFAAMFVLDDRTLGFLPSAERGGMGTYFALVGQLLRRKADGPLADALADADKHTLVAAARVSQVEGLFRDEFPRDLVPFRSLLKTRVAVLTVDAGARTTVTAKLSFADAAQARRAAPVLSTLIQLGTESLAGVRKEIGADMEWGPVALPLIDLASGALDKADVKADGSVVTARVEADIGPAVGKALAAFPDLVEGATSKIKTSNNLKQIGLAIHSYNDVMGQMPTDIISPTGKPILSWRVALLPFLEQDNMYKQLDLTKAWDDPANAKVLANMPDVFRVYGRDPKEKGTTYLQMPTMLGLPNGPSPIHVPGRRLTLPAIPDGTSNTIAVVEAADALPWAKPGDLLFDPTKAPKVGSPDRKWFHAGFADGSVRTLRRDKLTDEQLRALMTINGGEVVNIPD
jgi:hypothetical protein